MTNIRNEEGELLQKTLGPEEFAELFGVEEGDLPAKCKDLIGQSNFGYKVLEGADRDRVIIDILSRVESGQFKVAGAGRHGDWEKGWQENLDSFREQEHSVEGLVPKYIRPRQPVRLFGEYAMPDDPEFERNWLPIFQHWLFSTHFADAGAIYEFGCGSGINLASLADMYPQKKFVGLDWAQPSAIIVDELGQKYGWDMKGAHFNFFEPDESIAFEEGSLVFTVGALEQTGAKFEPFLQFLLERGPELCINIEPIVEWYDAETNLVDYAAMRFHRKREYLDGYSTRLKELESEGRIEILHTKRSFFGSLYLEGYSQLIWRPKRVTWT